LNFISLSYTYDKAFYAQRTELDNDNQILTLSGQWQGTRLSVLGSDTVQMLSGILGGGLNFISTLVDRTVYDDNYRVNYQFSEKTSVYVVGVHNSTDYAQGTSLLDYNTLTGTGGFE